MIKYFLLLLVFLGSQVQAEVLRCESYNHKYQYCKAKTGGRVVLDKQYSNKPCIKSVTWGYDKNGIWVDKGCRAKFHFSGKSPSYSKPPYNKPPYGGNHKQKIRCGSKNHRYHHCRVNAIRDAEITKKLSGAKCRRGRSWGVDHRGIWVDDGCEAIFRYSVKHGGRPPYGKPHRVRCGSENHRYNYCGVRTNGRVKIIKQLSGADCRHGRSWGFDRSGVWVDDGCEAIFQVGGRRPGYDSGYQDYDDYRDPGNYRSGVSVGSEKAK